MDDFSEQDLFQETPEQAASRIMKESAPFAAAHIVSLASDETVSPTVRLNAAKYIIDRTLGPIGANAEADSLESFLMELQDAANEGH